MERKAQGVPPHRIQSWLPHYKPIFKANESKRIADIVQGAIQQMERIFESAADRCHKVHATRNAQEATPKETSNVAAEPKTLALLHSADPHPVDSLANMALPPSSASNSQISPSPRGSTATSTKTKAHFRAAKLVSNKITTCEWGALGGKR